MTLPLECQSHHPVGFSGVCRRAQFHCTFALDQSGYDPTRYQRNNRQKQGHPDPGEMKQSNLQAHENQQQPPACRQAAQR